MCDGLALPGAWDVLGLGCGTRTVIVVIDGLGHHQLADHAHLAPLWRRATGVLTSVVPSTTPVALTSLGTGLAPVPTGWWGPASATTVGCCIRWPGVSTPGPTRSNPIDLVGTGPPGERGRDDREPARLPCRGSPGPRCVGRLLGRRRAGERVAAIAEAVARGPPLVYGYWEFLDRAAHMFGVDSPSTAPNSSRQIGGWNNFSVPCRPGCAWSSPPITG